MSSGASATIVSAFSVALIDEDPVRASTVARLLALGRSHWQVDYLSGLPEALERLSSEGRADVAILDVALRAGGLAAVRSLCTAAPHLAVVVLTEPAGDEAIAEALREGAQDYLVQGAFDRDLLERVLRNAIERKRAEGALRESQELLERAQQVAHVGSWVSGPAPGDRLTWSREAFRIFGVEESGFDGRLESFFARVHPEDAEAVRRASEAAIRRGQAYSVDHRIVRPDGTVRWVHEQADVVRDASGRAVRLIGSVQDITERKLLEEQLRQSQKMEAVGRLAGGIAHDFNNLLTAIIGYGELMLRRLAPADPLQRNVHEIRKAAERAASLTRQLLAFSRKQVLQPRVVILNAVAGEMEKMLRRLIGEDVQLVLELDEDLGRVKVDPGQMEQVVLNLALNARDAMPAGGRLLIRTSNAALDQPLRLERFEVPAGRYVTLRVADTGVGMDARTRSHIFEPFFTTKEPGKGTGLGLATVYGIVKQSEGYVLVESLPGRGSTFDIYLPRVDAAADPTFEDADGDVLGGSETVLLVEDEEAVRALAREILEDLGYTVIEAASPAAALDCAESLGRRIDLVLTDVVMPGMSGRQMLERLRLQHPGVRVLYMSGYTAESIVHHGVLDPGTPFLQKPFAPPSLARKVRDTLA